MYAYSTISYRLQYIFLKQVANQSMLHMKGSWKTRVQHSVKITYIKLLLTPGLQSCCLLYSTTKLWQIGCFAKQTTRITVFGGYTLAQSDSELPNSLNFYCQSFVLCDILENVLLPRWSCRSVTTPRFLLPNCTVAWIEHPFLIDASHCQNNVWHMTRRVQDPDL